MPVERASGTRSAGPWTVQPNVDAALAEALERTAFRREHGEVQRRFLVQREGHFAALDARGEALGAASCAVWGSLAWVGGMVVLPAARRQGIADALLRACLAHAEARGASVVGLDATPEGEPLCRKHGFVAVGATEPWARSSQGFEPAPSGRFAVYPVSACELMDLARYDAARFGGSRAPWLAAVMADFSDRAFVCFTKPEGDLAGFVLGQGTFVGPLVADAPEAAALLLRAAEVAGTPARAHLAPGAHARALFRSAGYAPEGAARLRMVTGKQPGSQQTLFANGSQASG